MNKRYLMKAVACIWLMTILSITGCGQKAATEGNTETQTQTEAERVDTGFVVTNPDSYDSADTAVLVDINEVNQTVTLLNLDLCRRYTLSMDGTTRFGISGGWPPRPADAARPCSGPALPAPAGTSRGPPAAAGTKRLCARWICCTRTPALRPVQN